MEYIYLLDARGYSFFSGASTLIFTYFDMMFLLLLYFYNRNDTEFNDNKQKIFASIARIMKIIWVRIVYNIIVLFNTYTLTCYSNDR